MSAGIAVVVGTPDATDAGQGRVVDDLAADIEHLARLASVVLNAHVNDSGWCAVCRGVAFPCDLAVVAEHNTALV